MRNRFEHTVMDIKPIRSQTDFHRTLREIEGLMHAAAGTAEGDRLDVLTTLIEAWEREHFPLDLPDPIEAIKFAMEQRGLTPRDLTPAIGQLNRVYEVLNRKRALTLKMIWNLHEHIGLPVEAVIRPYPTTAVRRPLRVAEPRKPKKGRATHKARKPTRRISAQ
jgi:HTH-type transcriptional regulator/antitoxin HigA